MAEQVEALAKRVANLEKDTQVYDDSWRASLFGSLYGAVDSPSRPRVGEGVRLLMQHLGLTFQHGQKAPDALVKAKKARKKK